MRFLMLIILLMPISLAAQSFPYTSDISKKAVGSIEDIAASIISDSFNPMTHYSSGSKNIYIVPAFFAIDKLMREPEIKGDNFSGMAFGAGGGYAFSDDILAYCILAGMKMRGDLTFSTFGDMYGPLTNSTDYSLLSVLAGGGYDIFKNKYISVPLYFGLNMQYYSVNFNTAPVTWMTYTVDANTSGNGLLYGVSGGIAASLKIFDIIKITPYYLFIHNFNKAKMEAEIQLRSAGLPATQNHQFSIASLSSGLLGLNAGFTTKTGLSISLAIGSMISSLAGFGSKTSNNGVKMKSAGIILSYKI